MLEARPPWRQIENIPHGAPIHAEERYRQHDLEPLRIRQRSREHFVAPGFIAVTDAQSAVFAPVVLGLSIDRENAKHREHPGMIFAVEGDGPRRETRPAHELERLFGPA